MINDRDGELWIMRDDESVASVTIAIDYNDPIAFVNPGGIVLREYAGEAWIRFEIEDNEPEWKEWYDEFLFKVIVPYGHRVKVWYTIERSQWGEFWEVHESWKRKREVERLPPGRSVLR